MKLHAEMVTEISLPLGKAARLKTVPQPVHVSPSMLKKLVLSVSAVKLEVEQVTSDPPAATSSSGPSTSGKAAVSISMAGIMSVVVLGPDAAMICCLRSVSF